MALPHTLPKGVRSLYALKKPKLLTQQASSMLLKKNWNVQKSH
jgi:hypothetical protein